jgi:peptidoglycan/xylan/chitin deacetylase (PgdA/CDA1 family)/ubiquinone/menaquinone biosynthesis C-methylase UbiE
MNEQDFWNKQYGTVDPWNYGSTYEQTKYLHTLELIPDKSLNAIELGCSEGRFTEILAPRVGRLLAIDISSIALDRARARCASINNVTFRQHDISTGMVGSSYDLVVCSEILYYLRDAVAVERFAREVRESLKQGGYLLMTHANMVSDDRSETGFDFNEIGSKFIGEVFASCLDLEFLQELRTELYRVQLFQRAPVASNSKTKGSHAPREVMFRLNADFHHPSIKWGGCVTTEAEARHCWVTNNVPILLYHRVADEGPASLAPYRVSPQNFEDQLAWLQRHGWQSLSLKDYYQQHFLRGEKAFRGKRFVLTFDDAYADFYSNAWPLLQKYGFDATVFVPTDYVGGTADWDRDHGPPARLMTWDQLHELNSTQIQFESHGARHVRLNTLSRKEKLEDALISKTILEKQLKREVTGYCYPFGTADEEARAVIMEAGFRFATCGLVDHSTIQNDPLHIRRIEVFGHEDMDQFIAKLPRPAAADPESVKRYEEMRSRRDRATYMDR